MAKTDKPIRVLSTRLLRPATLAAIEKLNWTIDAHAFIATRGLLDGVGVQSIVELLKDDRNFSWPLFSSVNAVKWLKVAFDAAGYTFPQGKSVLCVGSITAQYARQQLKALPLVVAPHAAGLLKMLPAFIGDGAAICYLCGAGRLEMLPEGLQYAGYKLTEINVYSTYYTPVKCDDIYDVVLFFSPSGVQSFFSVNSMPAHARAVCIGLTTEAALRHYWGGEVMVSPKPDENSMIKAIERWKKS
ncbi:MAG: uroporphyrinogen-III synthase [Chitinophagaceae bacterium]|jgi:uroporphyrinogen-III synthase|nr:uroporphyrinogen-III synthase [Chitinophagaceae bacterium]